MGNKTSLNTVFGRLGGIQLDNLDNRKIFQKKLYFLEQFGLDLGYTFSFYMYGPYSPTATKDAFDLIKQQEIAPETIGETPLSNGDTAIIDRLNTFLGEIPAENMAHMLELLASIHYIHSLPYLVDKSRVEIVKRLREMKPEFSFREPEEVDFAYDLLSRTNLLH